MSVRVCKVGEPSQTRMGCFARRYLRITFVSFDRAQKMTAPHGQGRFRTIRSGRYALPQQPREKLPKLINKWVKEVPSPDGFRPEFSAIDSAGLGRVGDEKSTSFFTEIASQRARDILQQTCISPTETCSARPAAANGAPVPS